MRRKDASLLLATVSLVEVFESEVQCHVQLFVNVNVILSINKTTNKNIAIQKLGRPIYLWAH